jgi:RNA polymerase sigma-54 factor
MAPNLRQSIGILKMSTEELVTYIHEQIGTNFMLEIDEMDDYYKNQNSINLFRYEGQALYMNSTGHFEDFYCEDEENNVYDFSNNKHIFDVSLKESLEFQLHISGLNENELEIGEALIDSIDENGFLETDIFDIACLFNTSEETVQFVLEIMQTFEPSGVFARDIKECLIIQLRRVNRLDYDTLRIIESFLEELAQGKIQAISKKTGIVVDKVLEIYNNIKQMEPKPGNSYYDNRPIKYIIPDIVITRGIHDFKILFNDCNIPSLKLNNDYLIFSKDCENQFRDLINKNYKEAKWLIKCIEQRRNTILKIVETILRKQIEFFCGDKSFIKPLSLKTIANDIGIHESTVSRAIQGKYLQCERGIFGLKYFFSQNAYKIPEKIEQNISSHSVKEILKTVIESETKTNPLSDSEVETVLKMKDIPISRRTVTKYRNEMGIPDASKRKRI